MGAANATSTTRGMPRVYLEPLVGNRQAMSLRFFSVVLSLLAFVHFVHAQGTYVINSISLPDGNTTYQGAPMSSGINFTEGDGFVDAVSAYIACENFVAVVDYLKGSHR